MSNFKFPDISKIGDERAINLLKRIRDEVYPLMPASSGYDKKHPIDSIENIHQMFIQFGMSPEKDSSIDSFKVGDKVRYIQTNFKSKDDILYNSEGYILGKSRHDSNMLIVEWVDYHLSVSAISYKLLKKI